jgi:hypothetical protein
LFHTATDSSKSDKIWIKLSQNPQDFPVLSRGVSLLHDSVVHCLPLRRVFPDPVYVTFDLPTQFSTVFSAGRLSISYSTTDVDKPSQWRSFRRTKQRSSSCVEFVDDDGNSEMSNSAKILLHDAKVVLKLHYLCKFAVLFDGREETNKGTDREASVEALVKICSSARQFVVDVLVLIGCDKGKQVGFIDTLLE